LQGGDSAVEIRNPKAEARKKSQARIPKNPAQTGRLSAFGFAPLFVRRKASIAACPAAFLI
jgi:hypothetical protein